MAQDHETSPTSNRILEVQTRVFDLTTATFVAKANNSGSSPTYHNFLSLSTGRKKKKRDERNHLCARNLRPNFSSADSFTASDSWYAALIVRKKKLHRKRSSFPRRRLRAIERGHVYESEVPTYQFRKKEPAGVFEPSTAAENGKEGPGGLSTNASETLRR
ncbi:hypothetical protein RB195_011306 [Necator americanus]|uniref:Uncharacterized protein n=1 Tax=Necator americanus TaxID=51031 RepID=A0ABR1D3M2_NECAM